MLLVIWASCTAQTLREAAQRGGRGGAAAAAAESAPALEGGASQLHAVAGALGALGMDTLKEFQVPLLSLESTTTADPSCFSWSHVFCSES